jgi:hypothetical protein
MKDFSHFRKSDYFTDFKHVDTYFKRKKFFMPGEAIFQRSRIRVDKRIGLSYEHATHAAV